MTSVPGSREREIERIRGEYRRRADVVPADYYSPFRAHVLFMQQQRARQVLQLLRKTGVPPLVNRRLLEVGCGNGDWLAAFETWGVRRENLAGIELDADRAAAAAARFASQRSETGSVLHPGADIRHGDATALPWPTSAFDIVLQSTVFSSILDSDMQSAVAAEMVRVLKPGGLILWYDLRVNNPANSNVRGVRKSEIRQLFPGCSVRLRASTLAPPIARRIVPLTWTGATWLEKARLLNSHYLGVIRRCADVKSRRR